MLIMLLSHQSLMFYMSHLIFIIVTRLFNVYCRSEVKMSQNNRHFTTKQCRAVMKYFFLKGNLAQKNYDMSVTLGDKRPSYYAVKNYVARLTTENGGRRTNSSDNFRKREFSRNIIFSLVKFLRVVFRICIYYFYF
jgi:hypothetical protein